MMYSVQKTDLSAEIEIEIFQSVRNARAPNKGRSSNYDRVGEIIAHNTLLNSRVTGPNFTKNSLHDVAESSVCNLFKAA